MLQAMNTGHGVDDHIHATRPRDALQRAWQKWYPCRHGHHGRSIAGNRVGRSPSWSASAAPDGKRKLTSVSEIEGMDARRSSAEIFRFVKERTECGDIHAASGDRTDPIFSTNCGPTAIDLPATISIRRARSDGDCS